MATAKELGIFVTHIGINASSQEEYEQIVNFFSLLLEEEVEDTPVSCMVGEKVEVLKPGGKSDKHHVAIHVNDMPAAEKYMVEKGFTLDESRRRLAEDGSPTTHLIYLVETIAGFEIHLTTD